MKHRFYFFISIFFVFTFACKSVSQFGSPPATPLPSTVQSSQNNQSLTSASIEWSTFLGKQGVGAYVTDVISDNNGNIYAVMHRFDSTVDDKRYMSLVKLGTDGNIEWSILITDTLKSDDGSKLAIDNDGNLYITGTSNSTWGNPIDPFTPYAGVTHIDAFLVKVNADGTILWNTFLPKPYIGGIVIDSKNNVYVNAYDRGNELNETALLVLSSDGNIQQNYGLSNISDTTKYLHSQGLAIDVNDNLYLYGQEPQSLSPEGYVVNGFFIAKLSNIGGLVWKTLLPSVNHADAYPSKVLIDDGGNVYLFGNSNASWGNPINPYDGGHDDEAGSTEPYLQGNEYFIAKLDNNGALLWNTFLNQLVYVTDFAIDKTGNLYATGFSGASWGTPVTSYNGNGDGLIICINSSGSLVWNMFIGGNGLEGFDTITSDSNLNLYAIGRSTETFGSPINPIYIDSESFHDVFVVKIQLH